MAAKRIQRDKLMLWALGMLICITVFPSASCAQQLTNGSESQAKSAAIAAPAAPAKPALADLAWLTGRWQGAWGPRVAQQVWTTTKAGALLGTLDISENDRLQVIELLSIAETSGRIEFRLRHFTPELNTWEKSGPVTLHVTSSNPKTIIFENSGDDQPKRAVLTLLDADTYVFRSELAAGNGNGDTQATEIVYHRQKEATAPHR